MGAPPAGPIPSSPPPATPPGAPPGPPAGAPPNYPYYNPSYPAYPGPYSPGGMGWPGNREVESRALKMIRTAAIVGLVGAILSLASIWIIPAVTGYNFLSGFPGVPANGTLNSSSFNNTTFYHALGKLFGSIVIFGIIGIVISIISAFFFRSGFALIRPFDPRFSAPATFTIVLIIGLILIIPAFLLFYSAANNLQNCVPTLSQNSTTLSHSCTSAFNAAIGGFALLAIGGIIAFIGLIGGLVLGSWRLGTRYNSTLFKVGAIFLIFFSTIGNILILIAAHSSVGQVESAPAQPPMAPGYPPTQPPPVYPPPPR